MKEEKTVQTKSSARGFVGLHVNGNVVGATYNMNGKTQLHPCQKISEDLASRGIIISAEKSISMDQLNFSNTKIVEKSAGMAQNMATHRGAVIER